MSILLIHKHFLNHSFCLLKRTTAPWSLSYFLFLSFFLFFLFSIFSSFFFLCSFSLIYPGRDLQILVTIKSTNLLPLFFPYLYLFFYFNDFYLTSFLFLSLDLISSAFSTFFYLFSFSNTCSRSINFPLSTALATSYKFKEILNFLCWYNYWLLLHMPWKIIEVSFEETGQDGGVERLWPHLLSWAHQNHNYLQNNH